MQENKIKVTNTLVEPPYKWRTTKGTVVCTHHSAHTAINPDWKWWKFWIKRFISVSAGWAASFNIRGNIKLDLSPRPEWMNESTN